MKQYSEEELQEALDCIANGTPIKQTAREYGIPKSDGAADLQRLSPDQEKHLASWIIAQQALGLPPTHAQAFIRRNPVIKVLRARAIDSKRVNGASVEVIRSWFQRLEQPDIQEIKPANRYNMDEAGVLEGIGSNGLVLGSTENRSIRKKQPGSKAWTSFIECISALGRTIPPLVIFKGKTVQQQWFPLNLGPFKDWQFTATENGWITDETAIEWLEKVFIPNTAPEDPSEYRLLVVDGHGSHTATDFMYLCFRHRIRLLFLPPHTSHVLQPLDLAVFSPLKTAYRKVLGNVNQFSNSTVIGKRYFLQCYQKARSEALSGQNIRSGWRAAGLWPVSMAKPLLSPLVVGNTSYTTSDPAKTEPEGSSRTFCTPRNIFRGSDIIWSTPRKSVEFKEQVRVANLLEENTVTQRQLFRKVRKAFDEKDVQVAALERQVEALQAQLETARPRKRRKVDLSPNSRFATIEDIQRTQMAIGEAEITSDEESDSEISEAGSCIVVAVKTS
ncbi:transposase [Apiospora kogelbergensis]|uniref:Transposase n=1 Tax=Apiospora kogelbergensis TaxID=1337665 RepID=A0AAW0QZJ0_9PEZI